MRMEFTRAEAANELGVTIRTVDRYIDRGLLTSTRYVNGAVRIDTTSVVELKSKIAPVVPSALSPDGDAGAVS
jgi:predicted site-specific integrase-resolvase